MGPTEQPAHLCPASCWVHHVCPAQPRRADGKYMRSVSAGAVWHFVLLPSARRRSPFSGVERAPAEPYGQCAVSVMRLKRTVTEGKVLQPLRTLGLSVSAVTSAGIISRPLYVLLCVTSAACFHRFYVNLFLKGGRYRSGSFERLTVRRTAETDPSS